MIRRFLCALLVGHCAASMGCHAQSNSEVYRIALENGLTVLLLENHAAKKVAVESFYCAGFLHEPAGKAHVAHLTEHLVCYSPTASYGPYEAFNLLQGKGMANAETLATFVHYDYLVPSSDL